MLSFWLLPHHSKSVSTTAKTKSPHYDVITHSETLAIQAATAYFPVNLSAKVGAWECGEHAPLGVAIYSGHWTEPFGDFRRGGGF